MNKKLCAVLALCALLVVNTGYAWDSWNDSDNGKAFVWNLAKDVGASSNQISFNQNSNGVWFFMKSTTLAQTQSSYSLLTGYTTPCAHYPEVDGILCWFPSLPYNYDTAFPIIDFNTNATTQFVSTITWPARTLAMHPAPDKLAIVGWRSPISGKISVKGSFNDLDANCGNGVQWFIKQGNKTLDNGALSGNKESFDLDNVKINQGEVLYFIVDPNNGDYYCDTTGLDLTITTSKH